MSNDTESIHEFCSKDDRLTSSQGPSTGPGPTALLAVTAIITIKMIKVPTPTETATRALTLRPINMA